MLGGHGDHEIGYRKDCGGTRKACSFTRLVLILRRRGRRDTNSGRRNFACAGCTGCYWRGCLSVAGRSIEIEFQTEVYCDISSR